MSSPTLYLVGLHGACTGNAALARRSPTDAKAEKLGQVADQLAERFGASLSGPGAIYRIDEARQVRVTSLAMKSQPVIDGRASATWKGTLRSIAADKTRGLFTAAEFGHFADAKANAVINRHERARDLKDAILAAADAKALVARDIAHGWN